MLSIGKQGAVKAARTQKARNSSPSQKWRIESEYLSLAEIADRVGTSVSVIGDRMAKLRKASGPITIFRLKEMGK